MVIGLVLTMCVTSSQECTQNVTDTFEWYADMEEQLEQCERRAANANTLPIEEGYEFVFTCEEVEGEQTF